MAGLVFFLSCLYLLISVNYVNSGDSLQSKLRLASIICGEDVTATLSSTADVTVYISYGERRHGQVVHTDTSLPPVVIENLQGVQEYVTQVHQTSTDGAANSVHRVQLFLNQPCLKVSGSQQTRDALYQHWLNVSCLLNQCGKN